MASLRVLLLAAVTTVLSLSLFSVVVVVAADTTDTDTDIDGDDKVLVWFPGFDGHDWDALRGSIVASNEVETTYTVFCAATTTAPASSSSPSTTSGVGAVTSCTIYNEDKFPFTFIEGPGTLHYSVSIGESFTHTQNCVLYSTTAAACTGTTSVASGFSVPPAYVTPLDEEHTTTLEGGDEVLRWGTLTLAEPPPPSSSSQTAETGYGTSAATTTVAPTPTATGGAVKKMISGTGSWGCSGLLGVVVMMEFVGIVL
ncbi:hypothetical protein F4778DRAFT_67138 [Xylariomycetidae sp. FL2044]|nr:hypothetical protein F4778DRAFT_67138 [Xylariomycetidae sp. FL2044]